MNKYSVFCRQADGFGTTWVGPVEAEGVEHAKLLGRLNCACDWEYDSHLDIIAIGVAEGDVNILFWED